MVAQRGRVLVEAVVVTGNSARADVDTAAQRGVADVAQMVDLAARPDPRFFGFHEIADARAGRQPRTRAQAGVGPDAARLIQHRIFEMAHRVHRTAGPHAGVAQHAVGSDAHALAQHHPPFKHAIHIDEHVSPAVQRAAHIDARGIGEGHAGAQQRLCPTRAVAAFRLGKLPAVIDSQHVPSAIGAQNAHAMPRRHRQGQHVGQVVLALGVGVAEAR